MSAETLNRFEEAAPDSSIRSNSSTPSEIAAGIAVGTVLDGKYRVEHQLGEGAMGIVLAATHIGLEEPVAIKFMRPEVQSLEGTLERFAKEAKIAARIRSEHVAKVLDVGEVAPLGPYIVMEYLEGTSLADLLDARLLARQGPLPAERVVEYLLQACEALAAAHAIGVTHRDVKPDNLFVTRHAGIETVKLLDFGISNAALTARAPDAEVETSAPTIVLGTPLYMSPEQLRSLPDLDGRTDIWSMGAVMHELLSGQPPFHAASVPEICTAILESQPASLPSSCPAALRAVVSRCLEKDRERRFQTVAELATALLPLAPREARAYASRASSILRASALHLDGAVQAGSWLQTRRIQSSALVAAATVLALSALGVAISLSPRPPAAVLAAPALAAPVRAPGLAVAEPTSVVPQTPSSAAAAIAPLAGESSAPPEPATLAAMPLQPQEITPEPPARTLVAATGKAARPARSHAAEAGSTSSSNPPAPTSRVSTIEPASTPEGTPAADPASAAASHVRAPEPPDPKGRRMRLVEPRSRVRLVERIERPMRAPLIDRASGGPPILRPSSVRPKKESP